MKEIIFISLLNEGSPTCVPVFAKKIKKNIYEITMDNTYDEEEEEEEDQEWEFSPGTKVIVKQHLFSSGENVLLAVSKYLPEQE